MPCVAAVDLQSSLRLQVLTIDFPNTFRLMEEIVTEYIFFYFVKPKHECLVWGFGY